MRILAAMALVCATAFGQGREVSGTLPADTEWSGEIRLVEDVIVPAGVTLTVAPGTRILPMQNVHGGGPGWNPSRLELHVRGKIVARGRAGEPIRFGCPPAGVETDSDERLWLGLVMLPGREEKSEFHWCSFENALGGIQVAERRVLLRNCVFRDNTVGVGTLLRAGRKAVGAQSSKPSVPVLQSCLFLRCRIGVSAEGRTLPDLERCVFLDCSTGIGNHGIGEIHVPLDGIGPRVERCEFLRCEVAVWGGSRVTNSIFEANKSVFRPSTGHEIYSITIDRYLRSNNLYCNNSWVTQGDVPLGAHARFAGIRRKGEIPDFEEIDPESVNFESLAKTLSLAEGSAGLGEASDNGDVGAFGRRGSRTVQTTVLEGLVLDTWLMCGPPGVRCACDPVWAKRRPKPGDASDGALWVVARKAATPVRMPGLELLAGPDKERTLVAYVQSEHQQTAKLVLAVDGSVVATWNGKEILANRRGGCRFGQAIKREILLKKGRNQLTLRVLPFRDHARMLVRVLSPAGGRPADAVCVSHAPKERKLRVTSIKKKTRGKHASPWFNLKLTFSAPVHWEDAVDGAKYRLVNRDGREYSMEHCGVRYAPERRTVTLIGVRVPYNQSYSLEVGAFRDAFGIKHEVETPKTRIRVR